MVKKIKRWLSDNHYRFSIRYTDENAVVAVCFDDMEPLRVAELFTQLDEWLVNGCNNAGFETVAGKPHCIFTAPLDLMCTLMYALDGSDIPKVITKSENINAVRGIMLDRYIHIRDGNHDIIRSMIDLDRSEIKFEDGAGKIHTIVWFIHREIIREA